MTDIAARPVKDETKPNRFWIAAAAVVLVAVGVAAILMAQTADDPPVATTDQSLPGTTWDHVLDKQGDDFQGILNSVYGETFNYSANEIAIRLRFLNGPSGSWLVYVFDGRLRAVDEWRVKLNLEDDLLVITGPGGGRRDTYQWTIEGDQLTLKLVEACITPPNGNTDCRQRNPVQDPDLTAISDFFPFREGPWIREGYFERTYTRVTQTAPGD